MKEYDYKYYIIKIDLKGEEEKRFEKIAKEQGVRFNGVLLRQLILQTLALIDQNYIYQEEQQKADEETSLISDGFDWNSVGEVVSLKVLKRMEYISPKDR